MINLNGKTLLPGFIDPHVHMCFSAMRNFTDLSPFMNKDMTQVWNLIKLKVQNAQQGDWVQFQLFDPMITTGKIDVGIKSLDKLSRKKAIFIDQANGHVAHVNSFAFQLLGITKDTPDPPHGRFMKDSKGQLTGQIQQMAVTYFTSKMPLISGDQYKNNFQKFLSMASSKGCTSLHDCGIGLVAPQVDISILHQVFKDPTPIRYSGYLISTQWQKWEKMNLAPQWKDSQLRINGVKCWVDGSTQAGSAYLRQPYLKPEWGVGFPNYTQQTLNQYVSMAHKRGYQVGIHANGDAGIDMALLAFQNAMKKQKKTFLRHRIQHSTICHKDQLARMKQLQLSPSFLIGHIYYYGQAFRDQIIGQRAYDIDPARTALDFGLKISLHSDYNCQPIDPLRCITNAVTRKINKTGQVLNQSQCITVKQAIKAMTLDAAWQCHIDDIVGSLKKGKFADFVILQEDPFKISPQNIINIKIYQTWKQGQKWYQG